jgi:hypothetical protein
MDYQTAGVLKSIGITLIATTIGYGGLYLLERPDKETRNFYKMAEVKELREIYKKQQDSLKKEYDFKKDSLKLDFDMKFNRLERKLK